MENLAPQPFLGGGAKNAAIQTFTSRSQTVCITGVPDVTFKSLLVGSNGSTGYSSSTDLVTV